MDDSERCEYLFAGYFLFARRRPGAVWVRTGRITVFANDARSPVHGKLGGGVCRKRRLELGG